MPTQSKHASINISLIQAREALMTQFRPILNQANITDQQWRIIRLLAENGTLDFQDLANQACILRPSLTGILTRLEKAGLVVRLKPSNDQRRVFLKLTAEGEKLYEEIGEEWTSVTTLSRKCWAARKCCCLKTCWQNLPKSRMR